MSNYVKSTNFTSKDSLVTGNPLKIIKGAEFDVEFNAIATAVSSKADTDSPSLTGTPTAPTPGGAASSGQVATVGYISNYFNSTITTAIRALYPVGSIYINATNSTNPATLLGFGTWVAFAAGRVPVGFNAADPLFDTAEETGGSKDAIVVSHTHTGTISTVADHVHPSGIRVESSQATYGTAYTAPSGDYLDHLNETGTSSTNTLPAGSHNHTVTINSTGSSGTNANIQPYITVYMWKRTA